jgi:hypothetical protein
MSPEGKRECDGGSANENVIDIPSSASLSSPEYRIKNQVAETIDANTLLLFYHQHYHVENMLEQML